MLAVILAVGAGAGGTGVTAHAQSPLLPAAPPATAPPLPHASSDASGAYVGDVLYVHAGEQRPAFRTAASAGKAALYALSPADASWTTVWTGRPVRGAVLVSDGEDLYRVGGAEAYDAGTGERVWWLDGLSGNRLPSPILAGKRLIVPSMDSRSNLAVPVEHRGRMPVEQVLWRGRNATASMSSPVVTGEAIYFINSRGVIRCLELGSGQSRWATRLASAAWATPIVNGDRVYVFGTDGVTSVFAADAAEPIELARNSLTVSERVYGVAAVDGALLVRTGRELIRIGSGSEPGH